MTTKQELREERAKQALIVHNYVFANPNTGTTTIANDLDIPRHQVRQRLIALEKQGKVDANGFDGQGGAGRVYFSVIDPEKIIEIVIEKKTETPPSLLLSKLWKPGHLELRA
ncbi:MAG: hypothetical protein KKF24_16050 [Gammaproteobacteria bacterium]|nr:hypothetical protein [Gammaproteobacteria bacterium]MBU1834199.1 hypothetical protein [Gammaproteobacteria bacterium]